MKNLFSNELNHIFLCKRKLHVMMIKQAAAKNTMWHEVFRPKYAQIRPENSFWCPPAFRLKRFVRAGGDHYAQVQA